MKPWFLIFFALLFLAGAQTSYAAFPVKDAAHARNADFKELVNSTIDKITGKNSVVNPALPLPGNGGRSSSWEGPLALGMGVAGIIATVAAFAVGGGGLLLMGLVFGIMAIVFGAMGFNTRNRGMAVTGFILGIVNVSLLLLIFLLALLLVAALV